MRLLGNSIRAIIAVGIAAASVAVVQPAANADPWGCPQGYLCLYNGQDGQGPVKVFPPGSTGTGNLGQEASNQVSGWVNNTGYIWWLYENQSWSGAHRALGADTFGNLGADWNNRATSVARQ